MIRDLETLCGQMREAKDRLGLTYADIARALARDHGYDLNANQIANYLRPNDERPRSARLVVALAAVLDGDAARWCALAGTVHPLIALCLNDPDFAARAYRWARVIAKQTGLA